MKRAFDNEEVITAKRVQTALGTVARPAYSNTTSGTTGAYFPTKDTYAISCAGTNVFTASASGITMTGSTATVSLAADGVTNDQVALLAALQSSAKLVQLPAGTILYTITDSYSSSPAVADKLVRGYGRQATTLLINAATLTGAKTAFSISNVTFCDMTIQYVVPTTAGITPHVFAIAGSNVTFERIYGDGGLTYSGGNLVQTSFCHFSFLNGVINNLRFIDNHFKAWKSVCYKANAQASANSNIFIHNNLCEDNYFWSFLFNSPSVDCKNIQITNNIFSRENNDDAKAEHEITTVNCKGVIVSNNMFKGYYRSYPNGCHHGEEDTEYLIITDNHYQTAGACISLIRNDANLTGTDYSVNKVVISGNTFSVFTGSVAAFNCISLTGNGNDVQNLAITNNRIMGDWEYGVRLDGSGPITITNNLIEGCLNGISLIRAGDAQIYENTIRNSGGTGIQTSCSNLGHNIFSFNEMASLEGSEILGDSFRGYSTLLNSVSSVGWTVNYRYTLTNGNQRHRVPVVPDLTKLAQRLSPFKMRFYVNFTQNSTNYQTSIVDCILTYTSAWAVTTAVQIGAGTGNWILSGTPAVIVSNRLFIQSTNAYSTYSAASVSVQYRPEGGYQYCQGTISANVTPNFTLMQQDTTTSTTRFYGGLANRITSVTSTPYTVLVSDSLIVLGSGAAVVNVPAASTILGKHFIISNESGGTLTNVIVLSAVLPDVVGVGGAGTISLLDHQSAILYAVKTGFWVAWVS